MGLSICRSIVEHSKGNITGESLPDGGARFKVLLPLVEAQVGSKAQTTLSEA
jgi:signal transduction histidine kinase